MSKIFHNPFSPQNATLLERLQEHLKISSSGVLQLLRELMEVVPGQ